MLSARVHLKLDHKHQKPRKLYIVLSFIRDRVIYTKYFRSSFFSQLTGFQTYKAGTEFVFNPFGTLLELSFENV